VITSDTYLANNAFDDYLNTTIPGTVGYNSGYITGRLGTWENPDWNTSLVNLGTGDFDGGIKYKELVPVWDGDYAKLLPGKHDGPITGLCFEILPYFMNGVTECQIRDDQYDNTGVDNCLSPAGDESSVTQCVNTVQNDTVRSGKAIIKTKPP
jgi:hypothetical protein